MGFRLNNKLGQRKGDIFRHPDSTLMPSDFRNQALWRLGEPLGELVRARTKGTPYTPHREDVLPC